MTAASWLPDPSGKHELRYWDGSAWTDHVADAGQQSTDPMPAEATAAPATAQAGPPAGGQGHPVGDQGGPAGSRQATIGASGISGDLIDGRYGEMTSNATGPSLQNNRMLRVRLGEPFLARQGAMVAYQGNVDFAYQGAGAAKFLKKAMTGEGLSLMQVAGQGDVFLANAAEFIHVLHLNNSGISVNGNNVLAFSTSLQYNIERVKGGSMAAGGLFNTSLRGSGWVAITTNGAPVVLNPAEAPTFADANALVAWSIDLQTSVKSSFKAGALIGRGSGEAFQVAFNGHGFVIVQPAEGGTVPPHSHGGGGGLSNILNG